MLPSIAFCQVNIGAGPSRNRALDESSADYVLFLDDDVEPVKNILHIYGQAILDTKAENVCGFIGNTLFPTPVTSLQRAIVLSDVTDMFSVSERVTRPAWGVSANFAVRVASGNGDERRCWDTRFGDSFPKTGGGEDVDFCLRLVSDEDGLQQQYYLVTTDDSSENRSRKLCSLLPHLLTAGLGSDMLCHVPSTPRR